MEQAIRERVNMWLDGPYDEDAKSEIRRLIADDEQELVNAFYKDLEFGTGGLRGVMGVGPNKINKYTMGLATQGFANHLRAHFPTGGSVAIACDSRNNSPYFAKIVADVFSANGIKVYLFESLRPTPELSFAIRHLGCQGGVVLTASHNPKEYNGYKAYWDDGGQLVPPHDKGVMTEVKKLSPDDVKFEGNEDLIEIIGEKVDEAYIQEVLKLSLSPDVVQSQKDLKIVFTPIHGTAITLVPQILDRMGFGQVTVVEEQSEPSGDFPTVVYPNPEEAEALSMGLKKAQQIDADILLGTDPDADRVGIAAKNHKGEFQLLTGNQTAVLLFNYIVSRRKELGKAKDTDFIAKTIVTSDLIHGFAKRHGMQCYDVLTGFKYIAELIKENEGKGDFVCGGEESYGYLIGSFVRDKDAVSAVAIICEMAAYAKSQGSSLFDTLLDIYVEHGLYVEKLKSLTKKGKTGAEEIAEMMAQLRANPPASINGSRLVTVKDYQSAISKDMITEKSTPIDLPESNVLQFFTEDGSKISARPSGTEPKIKFYFSVNAPLENREAYDVTAASLDKKIEGIMQDFGL